MPALVFTRLLGHVLRFGRSRVDSFLFAPDSLRRTDSRKDLYVTETEVALSGGWIWSFPLNRGDVVLRQRID